MKKFLKEELDVLNLAMYFKIVEKGSFGRFYYVEPPELEHSGSLADAKRLCRAKLEKVGEFTFEHPTTGYYYVYKGPNVKRCLLQIQKVLSREQIKNLINLGGAAFSVEQVRGKSSFTMNPETVPVRVKIYRDKQGQLPADILAQDVNYEGRLYSTKEIIRERRKSQNREALKKAGRGFELKTSGQGRDKNN